MFSNKNKKEKKENSSTTTATQHVSQTRNNLTVKTIYQQRSHSVSSYYSEQTEQRGFPSTSLTSLPVLKNHSIKPPDTFHVQGPSSSSLSNLRKDAKPISAPLKINTNYKSPYLNKSPVYSSFRTAQTRATPAVCSTSLTSQGLPVPVKTVPTKKLIVKKTGKRYDNNNAIPTYKTSSKNRGEVLIINNIMFTGQEERKGAKFDHERLSDLFTQIGFHVNIKKDLKAKDMKSQIESFSKKSALRTADISVVVVMSHGTNRTIYGGTEVIGIDNEPVFVEDIMKFFSGDNCQNMLNKPKIFIFQCCRGDNEQNVPHTDAVPIKPRPHADMLIAYSTLPGFVSYRSPTAGTWYIQTICDVFSQHAHEYHIEELLKIVDVELATLGDKNTQTSSYECRGFKRCYLHPA